MNTTLPALLIYALWIALVVYLIAAGSKAKRDAKPHLGQSFLLMFAMMAAFALPFVPSFRFLSAAASPVRGGIGLALAALGTVFFVWSRQTLGRNWSQTVSAKEGHELVTRGPYAYVRHPMYASGILSCLGSALAAGGCFVFLLLLLTPLFLWRVGAEDRLLARQFPDAFPAYKKRTKALIPFLW